MRCPECHLYYQTWWRPSLNFDLDGFDDDYVHEVSTATCPRCGTKLRLPVLRSDGGILSSNEALVERFGTRDPHIYYYLENYLEMIVRPRYFEMHGAISAFDFFCIVIWKANRAKSRIAKRLLTANGGYGDLDTAVRDLMMDVYSGADGKARLAILVEKWKFRLPMASAVLAVLYPEEFSVYDVRVCEVLDRRFGSLADRQTFESLWAGYSEYLSAVRSAAPDWTALRDKDRSLWGRSFKEQLERDVKTGFGTSAADGG